MTRYITGYDLEHIMNKFTCFWKLSHGHDGRYIRNDKIAINETTDDNIIMLRWMCGATKKDRIRNREGTVKVAQNTT